MSISEKLVPLLKKHFPNTLQLHNGPKPVASFSPIHPSWSEVEVTDVDEEVTIYLGTFTHVHIGNYDEDLSQDEREQEIAGNVVKFLDDLFADQIVAWGGPRSGGCERRDKKTSWFRRYIWPNSKKQFVWSGPI